MLALSSTKARLTIDGYQHDRQVSTGVGGDPELPLSIVSSEHIESTVTELGDSGRTADVK